MMYLGKEQYANARKRLIERLKGQGITDANILRVMENIPREHFLPAALSAEAYENAALPIGENQTISQPLVVATMTQALEVSRHHKVLEIGTGSGYQSAILCKLVRRLFTIERYESLSQSAQKKLNELGISNFAAIVGDGTLGWPDQAPFDRIIVTAASPQVPKALLEQLKPEGVLVIPVGGVNNRAQRLMKYQKDKSGMIHETFLGSVYFVPLVGEQGVKAQSA